MGSYPAVCMRFWGTSQIIIGIIMIILASLSFVTITNKIEYIGFGYWVGLWVIITGILACAGARDPEVPNNACIGTSLGFSVVASLISMIMMGTYIATLGSMQRWSRSHINDFPTNVHIALSFVAGLEMIVSFVSCIVSTSICCGNQSAPRQQGVTIVQGVTTADGNVVYFTAPNGQQMFVQGGIAQPNYYIGPQVAPGMSPYFKPDDPPPPYSAQVPGTHTMAPGMMFAPQPIQQHPAAQSSMQPAMPVVQPTPQNYPTAPAEQMVQPAAHIPTIYPPSTAGVTAGTTNHSFVMNGNSSNLSLPTENPARSAPAIQAGPGVVSHDNATRSGRPVERNATSGGQDIAYDYAHTPDIRSLLMPSGRQIEENRTSGEYVGGHRAMTTGLDEGIYDEIDGTGPPPVPDRPHIGQTTHNTASAEIAAVAMNAGARPIAASQNRIAEDTVAVNEDYIEMTEDGAQGKDTDYLEPTDKGQQPKEGGVQNTSDGPNEYLELTDEQGKTGDDYKHLGTDSAHVYQPLVQRIEPQVRDRKGTDPYYEVM